MSEGNMFEGIGETIEFEIENTDALNELFNETKKECLKIKKRFADGTYTEDDLLNHLPKFGLGTKDKIEMYVVESKYFEDLANRYINLKEIEKSHKEENGKLRVELEQEKEKNKELEEKLKIATAMLTRGTYPEQNEGDNDFDKQFVLIRKDKIKELIKKHEEARDLAGEQLTTTQIIADTNSLNFGRIQTHNVAIKDLEELLEEK